MLEWCKNQTKGIKKIEPSDNLCFSYIKRSESDLKTMINTEDHWKLISGYYACYDILYALLMKVGVKSEIHDCSIELMNVFGFDENDVDFLKKLKKDRIDVQYYLKDVNLRDENKIKEFVLKVKEKINFLTQDKIDEIRSKIWQLK